MTVGGLTEIPSTPRDLFRLQAARAKTDNLDFPLGQPCRALDPRDRLSGDLEHRRDGVGVQPPGTSLVAKLLGRPVGQERFAVWSRLGHRVVGVGGGQDSRGRSERGGVHATVVPRAVQSLRDGRWRSAREP